MIEFINKKLNDWALWSSVGRSGGKGFPSKSPICNLMPSSGGRGDLVGFDEDAMEIEGIVIQMRHDRPEYAELVQMFYVQQATGAEMARRFQCHRDTVYARLHLVHQYVMEALQDNDIAGTKTVDYKKFAKAA